MSHKQHNRWERARKISRYLSFFSKLLSPTTLAAKVIGKASTYTDAAVSVRDQVRKQDD
jgi:hypothetical protein